MAFPLSLLLSAKVQSQLVSFAKSLQILSRHFFFGRKRIHCNGRWAIDGMAYCPHVCDGMTDAICALIRQWRLKKTRTAWVQNAL